MLEAALSYAERGWFVFPVRGKEPATPRWSHDSTRDPERIRAWFASNPDLGVAVDCGRSGLVVLDGDRLPDLLAWAGDSADALNQGARWHGRPDRRSFLFRQPEPPLGCPVLAWGEVKGRGGYVVLPPSRHPDLGTPYVWDHEAAEPPVLPGPLVAALRGPSERTTGQDATEATPAEVAAFLADTTGNDRPGALDAVVARFRRDVSEGKSRHASAQSALAWALEEANAGFFPAADAESRLRAAFSEALQGTDEHAARPAEPGEWSRMLSWAVGRARASDPDERRARLPETDAPLLDAGEDDSATFAQNDAWEREVGRRLWNAKADREAKRRLAAEDAQGWEPPSDLTAADLVAEPDEDQQYRIAEIWPAGGNVLLAAQAKTGKTTLVLNVADSLLTGRPLFGRFAATPVTGRVLLLDLELSRRTLRRWLRERDLGDDRLLVLPLRGRGGWLATAVTDPSARSRFAAWLRERDVEVLILDPLAALLSGAGLEENANSEVSSLLRGGVAALQTEADVSELLVVHHAGHQNERARGASALQDWPDALWNYVRDNGNEDEDFLDGPAPRFLTVTGRDAEFPETRVDYHPNTRTLTIADGAGPRTAERKKARQDANDAQHDLAVLRAIDEMGGYAPSRRRLREVTGMNDERCRAACGRLVAAGLLVEELRGGNSVAYRRPAAEVSE